MKRRLRKGSCNTYTLHCQNTGDNTLYISNLVYASELTLEKCVILFSLLWSEQNHFMFSLVGNVQIAKQARQIIELLAKKAIFSNTIVNIVKRIGSLRAILPFYCKICMRNQLIVKIFKSVLGKSRFRPRGVNYIIQIFYELGLTQSGASSNCL